MGSLQNEVIWLQKANLNKTIQAFAFKNLIDSEIAENKQWLAYLCGIAFFLDFSYLISDDISRKKYLAFPCLACPINSCCQSLSVIKPFFPILDTGGLVGRILKKLNRSVFRMLSEKSAVFGDLFNLFFSHLMLCFGIFGSGSVDPKHKDEICNNSAILKT
ncbi:transmembrane protein, putative (macronuclear) [Tetrahymena thermophila SB210]|uniref:Transmembrane protein, putative n=1 Tax=Tetrahymena thermophila (strain SB210) TaxID=312017 RepID=W7XDL1_TETTS|nr:transmembrane protein, putative [Tetrahymena thermophila SB210]EWS75662.1 transmembrane protein, putative [Tetrahymena thermophila SB210]|eukprot:XP_012651808.1 transmembrane protein, putative [Tetrahymena thermophila SB210]